MNKMRILPNDIIINHIVPFTYEEQSKQLLRDIRSYVADFIFIQTHYDCYQNWHIMSYDILQYCNGGEYPEYNADKTFLDFLTRHIKYKFMGEGELKSNILAKYNRPWFQYRIIREAWGLLTPEERTQFINEYIIEASLELE